MSDDDTYEVGYRTPPRHRQYKKGECANPNGRRGRKGKPRAGELFARVHAESVAGGAGKPSRPSSRLEAVITHLCSAALTGQLNAIEALIDWHAKSVAGGDFSGDGIERVFDKSDNLGRVLELNKRRTRRKFR